MALDMIEITIFSQKLRPSDRDVFTYELMISLAGGNIHMFIPPHPL